jgi:hypothetical protein
MTELHDLLERAADDPRITGLEVTADLRRGRRALTRRRTRWASGVTGGVVAAGVVGYAVVPRHQDAVTTVRPAADPTSDPTVVPMPFYDVPTPPAGWHVVGERAQYVMLTRDGSGVTSVDAGFVGQIVIGLARGKENFDKGPSVEHDGRTFYVNQINDDATILSVRTAQGDWLQSQYPKGAFSVDDMVAYLDGVVVEAAAEPASG